MTTPSVEVEEVLRFLAQYEPFSRLPADALSSLTAGIEIHYARKGEVLIHWGEVNDAMGVIRSGAVDVMDEDGILLDRRDVGQSFGYSTLVSEPQSNYQMEAVEDSLILMIPREAFAPVAEEFVEFERYYSGLSVRIRVAADQIRHDSGSDVLRTRLGDFAITDPAQTTSSTTLQQAAVLMGQRRVSSLLIIDDAILRGIITDRDMRVAVAKNVDGSRPVAEVMATNLVTVHSDTLVFEAMLIMAERDIHHLPLVDHGEVTGIVAAADIMRLMQHDPLYISGDLSRQNTPEEMREVFSAAQRIAVRFIERGASTEEVQGLLTVSADALARRLLTIAEEKLGPPPVAYAFAVLGSQGRREMGLASDQDNALILSDEYDADRHGEYFRELAEFVNKGLATAGQPLCPGDMMAMNPQWRMTVSQWAQTFHHWVTAPEPDALLYAQTFFDMRGIAGEDSLVEQVHTQAVKSASAAPRMHAHLAALAVRREPPLGVFRGLTLTRRGEHAHTLNVKAGGLAAIVQIARLFGIIAGQDTLSTRPRLAQSAGESMSHGAADDLVDAFDFLTSISLRAQVGQLNRDEEVTYHIDPRNLTTLERENLRDAFQIIKRVQSAMAVKFPVRNI